MIKKLFFSILLTMSSQGFANEPGNTHRIQSLLPEGVTLNIEPYIPSDFILIKPCDKENHGALSNKENFWMPDGLYEKYMADPKSAHRPFIHFIIQNSFKRESKGKSAMKEYVAQMTSQFPVQSSSLRWGNYDVIAIKMNVMDDEHIAFVDLNKEDGSFIIFILKYHKKLDYGNGNHPSEEDVAFWNDFLNKTKAF